jgi:hypothetical protein
MNPTAFADFNEHNVDRIVASTCRHDEPPARLDRVALLADLIGCYGRYKKIISSGAFKSQSERQSKIRKSIEKIVKLLKEDDADGGVILKMSQGASSILAMQLLDLASLLEHGLQRKPGEFAIWNKARYGLIGSALQELVGIRLPAVYEKHFGKPAGSSRDPLGGPPYGPYIRFALQLTKEWKIDCSAETIDAALSREKFQKNTL